MARNPNVPVPHARLRIYTIIALIPTIALAIPYDVVTHRVALSIGILPMSASALLALIFLTREKPFTWPLNFVLDALSATAIMLVLVPWWIKPPLRWYSNNTTLGAYATVPMLFNFAVHVFFAVRESSAAFNRAIIPALGLNHSSRCPECQREFHAAHSGGETSVALPVSEAETRAATSHQDQPLV